MNTYYIIGLVIAIVIVAAVGFAVWSSEQDLHNGKFTEFEE